MRKVFNPRSKSIENLKDPSVKAGMLLRNIYRDNRTWLVIKATPHSGHLIWDFSITETEKSLGFLEYSNISLYDFDINGGDFYVYDPEQE